MEADVSSHDPLETVLNYHERTKHHRHGYARSLGYLDWDTQPNPFRFYEGAEVLPLERIPPGEAPSYDALFSGPVLPVERVNQRSLSQLFYDSLAISAWKAYGESRWSLRVNPSSGNLHPTEGYLISGPIEGLVDGPAVYHYSPHRHALEVRAKIPRPLWEEVARELPGGAFLIGLTSIYWRESWKYGERAFRYCQHDAGHAVGAVAVAAAVLGWGTFLLDVVADSELAVLLGVAEQHGSETEHPDCLLLVDPEGRFSAESSALPLSSTFLREWRELAWVGQPNRLSSDHVEWPIIEEVSDASIRPDSSGEPELRPTLRRADSNGEEVRNLSARQIIRQRRSAVALDGCTGLSRDTFYRILRRVNPAQNPLPFQILPWQPVIHLALFVHRVEGLSPGLYLLEREFAAREALRKAFQRDFRWSRPDGCPEGLELFLLREGDCRETAQIVSCHQEIASDGVFALGMIASFEPELRRHGPHFYKRLHWEAGAIGQVLYLEAEAAGVRSTGIGCFFDDAMHSILGLHGRTWQSLYHFTVGKAVEDDRLTTLPAYPQAREEPS